MRPWGIFRRAAAIGLALVTLSSTPAFADGTADEADLHFDLGLADFGKGNYNDALVHFFHSNRLVPNRNVLFNIARTYEAMKRYTDAHRYYTDSREGETDTKKKADADAAIARLAPNVAVLDVVTSPPGATIYIDRKDLGSRGVGPRKLAMPAGKYTVLAEMEGYEPKTSEPVEVTIGKSTTLTVELTKVVGTVHVDVTGTKSASVRVDDEKAPVACAAPCDLPLAPGRHELYFESPGFQAAPRTVVVTARQTSTATAAFVPLTGSLVVRADERDATVSIDGKQMGFTPVVLQGVPAGPRTIQVGLRGFSEYKVAVDVKPNQQADAGDISLQPAREVNAVSRNTETVDDAPSSVTIIDRRELAAFGYPTIAEALRGVRGITLNNDHGYASISIRGIGQPNDYGNRLLVLADGQSLNDNLLASSYVGSDGRVDLHDVDRIEVARGPGSLLYGTGAFSGLVNLVTRPREEPNTVEAGIGGYDNGALHGRVGGHYHFNKDAGVWASATVGRSEGYDLPVPALAEGGITPIAHGTDAFLSAGTAGRFYYKSFTAQWFFHQRDQIIPVGAYATTFDDPRSHFNDRRYMTEVRFEPKLSDKWQLLARAHANRYEFHSVYEFGDSENRESLIGTWFGGEARIVWSPIGWLRITAGGEGQYHPEAALDGASQTTAGEKKAYLHKENPYQFGAGYGLIEGSPASWFKFTAGARVDVYSTFGPIVVPRAALIFKPGTGNVLKIMGGRAFRAPSIYEQVYNDGGQSTAPGSQPDRGIRLGPESIYSGEIEFSHRFLEDWIALGAAHASYVEGLMTTVEDDPNVPADAPNKLFRYANSQVPALVAGGDLELRRDFRRGFMLSATYGFQHTRFLDASQKNPRLLNAPEHFASIRTVAPVIKELVSFGFRATLEAPRRINDSSNEVTGTSVIADATVSGYVRDIGVRYVVGVYNIADRRHELPVSSTFKTNTLPQNGRTFLVDAIWSWP